MIDYEIWNFDKSSKVNNEFETCCLVAVLRGGIVKIVGLQKGALMEQHFLERINSKNLTSIIRGIKSAKIDVHRNNNSSGESENIVLLSLESSSDRIHLYSKLSVAYDGLPSLNQFKVLKIDSFSQKWCFPFSEDKFISFGASGLVEVHDRYDKSSFKLISTGKDFLSSFDRDIQKVFSSPDFSLFFIESRSLWMIFNKEEFSRALDGKFPKPLETITHDSGHYVRYIDWNHQQFITDRFEIIGWGAEFKRRNDTWFEELIMNKKKFGMKSRKSTSNIVVVELSDKDSKSFGMVTSHENMILLRCCIFNKQFGKFIQAS